MKTNRGGGRISESRDFFEKFLEKRREKKEKAAKKRTQEIRKRRVGTGNEPTRRFGGARRLNAVKTSERRGVAGD
jgi:hypothetical protein